MKLGIVFGALLLAILTSSTVADGLSWEQGVFPSFLVLLAIMLILSVSVAMYLLNRTKVLKARTWPYVMGRTTKYNVMSNGFFRDDEICLEYTYKIKDVSYTNDTFRNLESLDDLDGKMVRVYYNPASPWRSYLNTSLEQNALIISIPAIMTLIFCTLILVRLYF